MLSADEIHDAIESAESLDSELAEVWLEPDSEYTQAQSLLSKRQLVDRIFRIGRRGAFANTGAVDQLDYALAQNEPYTISKLHCELELRPTGVLVRDLGSRYGTKVNDLRLGERFSGKQSIALTKGRHCLVLGPRGSRFRFVIEVK